jgi:hypothetical protein
VIVTKPLSRDQINSQLISVTPYYQYVGLGEALSAALHRAVEAFQLDGSSPYELAASERSDATYKPCRWSHPAGYGERSSQ